jgi:hypothetical protein
MLLEEDKEGWQQTLTRQEEMGRQQQGINKLILLVVLVIFWLRSESKQQSTQVNQVKV